MSIRTRKKIEVTERDTTWKVEVDNANSRVGFFVNGTEVGRFSSDGLLPSADSTDDLGTTSLAWANVYADAVKAITGNDLALQTVSDNRQVELNSRSYTQTSGDTIGFQAVPSQGATTTGEVFGGQIKPRVASGFNAATVNGLGIDSELKGPGAGQLSSDLRGINLYMGATGSGSIGGNVVGLRARVESNINPTGDIVLLLPVNHEGSQGWDGLIKFDAALGTHSMTTNSDKTGSTKSGTIKVRGSDGTLYHIQLYADS